MKQLFNMLLFSGIFLLANATGAFSADMYVTDILKLSVRTQQGRNTEPVAVIESGQPVSLIRSEGDWALVRLPDNKEGWVYRRYLTHQPSSRAELKKLKIKHKNLVLQSAGLLEENEQLKKEIQQIREEKELAMIKFTKMREKWLNSENLKSHGDKDKKPK